MWAAGEPGFNSVDFRVVVDGASEGIPRSNQVKPGFSGSYHTPHNVHEKGGSQLTWVDRGAGFSGGAQPGGVPWITPKLRDIKFI